MPHQCLKCGKLFDQGSFQLLKGCPDCNGNRFFFTKEPLNNDARKKIMDDVGKDINTTIIDFIGKKGNELIDKSGYWVKLKPKDLRKAVEKHLSENEKIITNDKKVIDTINNIESRKSAIEKIEIESKKSNTPETIDIESPGKYNIDIKGLLEEEPIIIQKDGSYILHLPSIFKMIDKEKK